MRLVDQRTNFNRKARREGTKVAALGVKIMALSLYGPYMSYMV